MSILKIARMGHPVLIGKAQPVNDPQSDEIRRLASDMADTLNDAGGVGLAAPQVHAPLRLMIFHVPTPNEAEARYADAGLDEEEGGVPLTVLINPEFEPLNENEDFGWEGCLSLPGLTGLAPRYARIRYKGLGLDGQEIERQASGFHARVVQHELDHLDGVLFPSRMPDLKHFGFSEEIRRYHLAPEENREEKSGENDEEDGEESPV